MSVTIAAVPAVANGPDGMPAAHAPTEQSLSDFVANVQRSALPGMPHLANPAALAAEILGNLRGYLEKVQSFDRAPRMSRAADEHDSTIFAAVAPGRGEPPTDLHGGPARESLEPADRNNGGVSAAAAIGLAQLQQAMDLALASMNFATQTALLVRGTSQISHSANTLLRGQ